MAYFYTFIKDFLDHSLVHHKTLYYGSGEHSAALANTHDEPSKLWFLYSPTLQPQDLSLLLQFLPKTQEIKFMGEWSKNLNSLSSFKLYRQSLIYIMSIPYVTNKLVLHKHHLVDGTGTWRDFSNLKNPSWVNGKQNSGSNTWEFYARVLYYLSR